VQDASSYSALQRCAVQFADS